MGYLPWAAWGLALVLLGMLGQGPLGWAGGVVGVAALVVCVVFTVRLVRLGQRWLRGSKTPWAALIATVGLAGLASPAPGTLGALLALPAVYLCQSVPLVLLGLLLMVLTVGSTAAVHRYLATHTQADPSEVVIDEWIGQWIALAAVPVSWPWVLAGFVLFRLFDIFKPGPVGWAERNLGGAVGVMGDDVVAGLLAGGVLVLVNTGLRGLV